MGEAVRALKWFGGGAVVMENFDFANCFLE